MDNTKKPTLLTKLRSIFNLVIADSKRIKQDVFMIIVAALAFFSVVGISAMFKLVVFIMTLTSEAAIPTEALKAANQTFSFLAYGISMSYYTLGFFVIAAVALFSGRDFGYRTIRIKVQAGNSRTKIYFSILTVNLLIGLTFIVLGALASTLINIILFGFHFNNGAVFVRTLLALLPYISTITITTFFLIVTRSQIASIIISVGIAYLVPQITTVFGLFVTNKVALDIIGSIPYQTINEIFVSGLFGGAELIGDSMILFPTPTLSLILRSTVAPAVIIAATIIGGLRIFKKADLN